MMSGSRSRTDETQGQGDLASLLGGLLQTGDLSSLVSRLLGQLGSMPEQAAEPGQAEEGEALLGGLLSRGAQQEGGLSPQLLQTLQADPALRAQAAGTLPGLARFLKGLGLPPILAEKLLPGLLEGVLGKKAAGTAKKSSRSRARSGTSRAPRKKSTASEGTAKRSSSGSSSRSARKPAARSKSGAQSKSGSSRSSKGTARRKSTEGLNLDSLLDQVGDALGQDKK